MTGKVAIVTGAARGIGAATARALAARGYSVCVNYRSSDEAAASLVQEIKRSGGQAIAVCADVAVDAAVEELFAEVDHRLGRVSALVNNAGVVARQSRVEAMDGARIERVLRTNVIGAFLCCREAVRRMSSRSGGGGGSIINVSSAASRTGSPGEYVDYAASKAAVDALTRGLSLEVAAEGIRVNCVRPGFIHTDIHASGGQPGRIRRLQDSIPMRRGGTPAEVAAVICWLLSDEAAYCTGTFVDCAGGV